MNILDGTYEPTSGTIGKGETVRIAHFKQELPEFDEDMRVLDYIPGRPFVYGVGRWLYIECWSDS